MRRINKNTLKWIIGTIIVPIIIAVIMVSNQVQQSITNSDNSIMAGINIAKTTGDNSPAVVGDNNNFEYHVSTTSTPQRHVDQKVIDYLNREIPKDDQIKIFIGAVALDSEAYIFAQEIFHYLTGKYKNVYGIESLVNDNMSPGIHIHKKLQEKNIYIDIQTHE
ncbi:MAG: hypothetical protein WC518_01960 [Patescibacteria group bacterium]